MNFKERERRREQALEVLIKAANSIVTCKENAETLLFLAIAVTHVSQIIGEDKTKEAYDVAHQIHESRCAT